MKSLGKVLFILLFAVVGAGFGYSIGGGLKRSPLGQEMSQLGAWDIALMLGSVIPVLAFHEFGHVVGAKLKGMRFLLFIAGPFQITRTPSGLRFNLVWNLGTFGGLAAALPDPKKPIRPQLLSLIVGGPAASLLLTLIGLAVFQLSTGPVRFHGAFIGGFSALIFLVTAIPSRAGGFMSDGMQFIEVLKGGQAVMQRQKILALSSQSLAGIRPRDWDQQLREDLMQSVDSMQPLYQAAAHFLALLAAIDRQDAAAADQHTQWLSKNFEAYPVGLRQSLTLELCLQSLRKGDLEAARKWHGESKGGLVDQARRCFVDAELALAEGRHADARQAIDHGLGKLNRTMDPGVAVMTRDELEHLKRGIPVP
ncbi:MAG: hypothetical protein JNM43_09110 [Planctomycetaceae bacterium]|nr:hypothetical protein [Planctomycetaceae bacterium]